MAATLMDPKLQTMLKPMLCTDAGEDGPSDPNGVKAGWSIERKYDGWRALVYVDAHGAAHLFGGRNGEDYTGQLPYLEREIAELLPPDTLIDGELVGRDWGEVQSAMTTHGYQGTGICLVVFDLLRLCMRDIRKVPMKDRRAALDQDDIFRFDEFEHVALVRPEPAERSFHNRVVALGGEGTVWKKLDSPYLNARRSPYWIKWKHEQTDDFECTGFEPGKGKYQGMIGAITFRLPSGQESTASGMDDITRAEMTASPQKWIGQVIEVKHNGFLPSGAPRHPQYVRLRSDKPKPKPTPKPRATRRPSSKPWMRNYGAMGSEKLLGCISELEGQYGDAYQRVLDHGGNLTEHIAAARGAALNKGCLL